MTRVDPIEEASAAVGRGGLIVIPTDTVYGVGTRPDDDDATGRLFQAKRRPEGLALGILVASLDQADQVADLDHRARRLISDLWPGALTLVVPRSADAAGWSLGGDGATIGLRLPRHPLARAVLAATGPMAVTSANRSGEPPAADCDAAHAEFGDLVEVYLCQDEPLRGEPSTVIDLAHGGARLLRSGALDAETIERSLPGEGPLLDSRPSP